MLFTALVLCENGTVTTDGISYEGKLWLVPKWLESRQENISKPALMIRFDNLPHRKLEENFLHNYVVDQPMPRAVLDGQLTAGFEILSGTQITFGIRRAQPLQ